MDSNHAYVLYKTLFFWQQIAVMADAHSKTQGHPQRPPNGIMSDARRWFYQLCAGRKYILVESRQQTCHLLRLLRTIQTAGWLLTQQQKQHISALLHSNTPASHAASVPPRPPRPPTFPTPPALYHSESDKGKRKDFAGTPSRLAAEPGATCCAFAPVLWRAHA